FKKFMKVIRELTDRVEEQHTKVLEQKSAMEVPAAISAAAAASAVATAKTASTPATDFATLVGNARSNNASSSVAAPPRPAIPAQSRTQPDTNEWIEFDHPSDFSAPARGPISSVHASFPTGFPTATPSPGSTSTRILSPLQQQQQQQQQQQLPATFTVKSPPSSNFASFAPVPSSATQPARKIPTLAPPPQPHQQQHHQVQPKPSVPQMSNHSMMMSQQHPAGTQYGSGLNASSWSNNVSMGQQQQQQKAMVPPGYNSMSVTTIAPLNGGGGVAGSTGQGVAKRNQTLNEFDPFG
ncbi:hypothetical protein HDU98_000688, partial [Podochytrium sp. JEL0797]